MYELVICVDEMKKGYRQFIPLKIESEALRGFAVLSSQKIPVMVIVSC
jgi:hypothetical protein